MSNIATQRVSAGAKFLDSVQYAWANKIDISKLEMYDGDSCIIGQLYGGYETGLSRLGISSTKAMSYGFEDESYEVTYTALTAAWKAYLTVKPGKYTGKVTGKAITVHDAMRVGDKNYVVYTKDTYPNDPMMTSLNDFLGSYEPENATKDWRVGQILKATTGNLFMYAGEQKVWKLSGIGAYGASYMPIRVAEKDFGKLAKVETVSGHDLVGGMDMNTFK